MISKYSVFEEYGFVQDSGVRGNNHHALSYHRYVSLEGTDLKYAVELA